MKEIDILEPLSPEEILQESEIINQIKQGMEFANRSYFMIIDGLRKVKELRLYREVGSLRDWALARFGFGDREYNYYLKAGEVVQNLRAGDPDANPRLTHALAIGMLESEDQLILWEKIKESGKPLTKKLIINMAKELEASGDVRARQGVRIKGSSDADYLCSRILTAWSSLEVDAKPDLIKEMLSREDQSFLKLITEIIIKEIKNKNDRQH
jgi:hypothetical protein